MSFRKGTFTVVITMLFLAFAGQTLAVAGMPCPMGGEMPANMDDMSAGMNDMAQDDMGCGDHTDCHTSAPSGVDLCQQDSSCFKSSCAPAAILPSSSHTPEWYSSPGGAALLDPSLKQTAITSLYRPPISR